MVGSRFARFHRGDKSRRKARSLRTQIRRALVTILALSLLAAFGVSTLVYLNISNNSKQATLREETEQLKGELSRYLVSVEGLAYSVGYSNIIQNLLNRHYSEGQRAAQIDYAKYYLYSVSDSNQNVEFVFIENTDDGYKPLSISQSYSIHQFYDIEGTDFFPKLEKNGYYMEIGKPEEDIYTNYTSDRITFYYLLHRANTFATKDIIIVTVPLRNITSKFNSFDSICINVYCNDQRVIRSFEDGAEYSTSFSFHKNVFRMDSAFLKRRYPLNMDKTTILLMTIMATISCVVVMFFYIYLSRYLITPISNVSEGMKSIAIGNFGIQVNKGFYKDEIGTMIDGYNNMSLSLKKLIDDNKEYAELQKKAQIKILQSQINPHFLANTLELINSLILNGRSDEAMKVSGALGKMYRYNQNLDSWSTLGEEIGYTVQYLTIMQYRIHGLQYELEIPDRFMHLKFMRAILQPIVENSILHGFESQREDCVISITMIQENSRNVLTIMDNGKGMTEETLDCLTERLDRIVSGASDHEQDKDSIGLANVMKRLRIEYGLSFQYTMISADGKGTCISLLLPMED